MPHLNATIEAIAIKPLAQPDNYGNTFRVGMKFGEDWYSYGTIKKDQLDVKVGNDWVTVTKGMEVEFMYKVNGDFKNVEKKSFTVTNQEGGVAPRAAQQQAPQQQGGQTQQASKGSYVNAAEIGQCLNLAVDVLKLDSKQLLDDKEVTKAIAWYKAAREKFHELYVGVEAGTTPNPKPAPKKAPVVIDDYDDDSI
jgi:hypothetical protein